MKTIITILMMTSISAFAAQTVPVQTSCTSQCTNGSAYNVYQDRLKA